MDGFQAASELAEAFACSCIHSYASLCIRTRTY